MRVVSIEPLASLSPAQAEMAERLGQWPNDQGRRDLRVYWLDDGDPLIAPWNPAIKPGMNVVGEDGAAGAAFTVPPDERESLCVRWAAKLVER